MATITNGSNSIVTIDTALQLIDSESGGTQRELIERIPIKKSFLSMATMMGYTKTISTDHRRHYEQTPTSTILSIGNIITAPTGTGNAIVEVSTNSMIADTSKATGNATYYANVGVGSVFNFPDRVTRGYVLSVDTTTNPANWRLTVKPMGDNTTSLVGKFTANGVYTMTSSQQAPTFNEGAFYKSGYTEFVNGFSKYVKREKYAENELQTMFLFAGENSDILILQDKGAQEELLLTCGNEALYGRKATNITQSRAGEPDQLVANMDGLVPIIQQGGRAPSGAQNLSTLNFRDHYHAATLYLTNKRYAGKVIMDMMGMYRYQKFADFYTSAASTFNNGRDLTAVKMALKNSGPIKGFNETEVAVFLDISTINIDGFTFVAKQLNEVNNEASLGNQNLGVNYGGDSIMIPLDVFNITTKDGNGQDVEEKASAVTVLYKGFKNRSGEMKTMIKDGTGFFGANNKFGVQVTNFDASGAVNGNCEITLSKEISLQVVKREAMQYYTGV